VSRALRLAAAALLLAAALAEAVPRWGWLGVRIRDLSEQEMEEISRQYGLREGFGAVVVEVIKETPAEAAGLRSGDLVVGLGDRPVVDTRTLQRYIARAPIGETVALVVLRREQGRRRIPVRIGRMPDAVAAERIAAEFGFLVREPEPQGELGEARPPALPAVSAVLPRSRAEAAGLQVGDVLLEVNGRPVEGLESARQALLAVGIEVPLTLVVRRGTERVPLRLEAARPP
jgi:serine protease Do